MGSPVPTRVRTGVMAALLVAAPGWAPPPPALAGDPPPRGAERGGPRAPADPAVEKALAAGVDWLVRHQGATGLWDADGFPRRCEGTACDGIGKGHHGEDAPCPFDHALSAMAALALVHAGVVPDAAGGDDARALERALAALDGGGGDPWALALSTAALGDAEAREGKGRWKRAALAGAKRLLDARQKDGGWAYIAEIRPGSDVPYTAFVVQALVAARGAGASLPEDLGPGVDRFLDSLEEKKGKLAYLVEGRKYGYTPTTQNAHNAAAIRELLGVGLRGARHRAHLALVDGQQPKWEISFRRVDVPGRGVMDVQVGNLSLYQWWYGTIASYESGGERWRAWWSSLRSALLPHQGKSGCAKGSWPPEGLYERTVGGRVMSTALGVLMLAQPARDRRP